MLESQTEPRYCPGLSGGTAGLPEPGPADQDPGDGNGLAAGDPTSAPASLPANVHLRSARRTYNRRYWFALRRGHIYFKSNAEATGVRQPWAPLPTPACFDGEVSGISADDDELVALDRGRHVFTLDGALGDPALFNWTVRWGPVFWTGPGRRIPKARAWSWSVSSPREDGTFTDTAGNAHEFGAGKVSHIWLLRRRGRRLTYLDPWLPSDESYEMCGPRRGRFRSVGLSASGSTVFVINRLGDMFTRLYDFDIAGANSLFFTYSYEDQRGSANPAIQLPSQPWIRQPKISGRITNAISIAKHGRGSVHRTLRVAGRSRGRRGYWEREISAPRGRAWRFVATGGRVAGHELANPRANTAGRGLARPADRRFAMRANGVRVAIPNFNVYCSPARLRVTLQTGRVVRLRLHTVDAIRQRQRARGLDSTPRIIQGTIEAPKRVLASKDPAVQEFAAAYLTGGRFTATRIDATRRVLSFPTQPWTLTRRR